MVLLRPLLAVALLAAPSFAQFGVDWSVLYENEGTSDEEGRITAVAMRANGEIYAAAVSVPSARPRFLLYGPNGQRVWSRLHGPTSCTYSKVLVGASEEALFVGERSPTSVAHTLEVASVATTGALNWSRSFPLPPNAAEPAHAALGAGGSLALGSASASAATTRFATLSANGTLLFEHTLDLAPGADESVSALELASDGDGFLAGNFGTSGFVARIDTAGQILWSQNLSGGLLASISVRALRVASDGTLVSLESETTAGSPARLRWRRFDGNGTPLGATELVAPLAGALTLRGLERASDGSLWTVGEIGAIPPRLLIARFDPARALADSFLWSTPIDLGTVGRATLVPASAGQVWVTTNVWRAPLHSTRHGAALLFGADTSGLGLRALFGDDVELKEIGAAALAASGRLVVAGRSDAFTGPYFYFDPIAWLAQLDASAAPRTTCAGQTDSAGCTPTLTVSGLPIAGATEGFVVSCVNLTPQRSGLFFHGTNGPASSPLGGGTLCVASPLRRGPLLDSGQSALACGGALALDWSAYASGTLSGSPPPGLTQPGTVVHLQGWIRDPGSAAGSFLSDTIRFVVLP